MHNKTINNRYHTKLILEELEARQLFSDGAAAIAPPPPTNDVAAAATTINVDANLNPVQENPTQAVNNPSVDPQNNVASQPIVNISNPVPPSSIDNTTPLTATEIKPITDTPITKELVFVDTKISNYQALVDDIIQQGNSQRQFEIIMLKSNQDGIAQITDTLANNKDLNAVHLITHGSDGSLDIGNSQLNFQTLSQHQEAISIWSHAFADQGDILIYGCNVAQTQFGQSFVDYLSSITQTDITASEDATGFSGLGADWDLEYQSGTIEAQNAISLTEQEQWTEQLAVTSNGTVTSAQMTNSLSLTWSHTVTSGNNRVLIVQLAIDNLGAPASSVTYGGVALTLVGRGTGNHAVEIWRLVNPTVGTANVVATFSGTTSAVGGASTYNGVNQTTPFGTFVSASGTGTTASVTAASTVGDLVIDAQYWQGAPTSGVPGAGQTVHWWQQNATLTGGSTTEAGAASVTMSGSFSSAVQWEIGAVSIKADTSSQISTTFQEGANGYTGTQDTYLNKISPNTTYGTSVSLLVDDGSPNDQNSLIRFDNIFGTAIGKIPVGSTINDASLSIYVTNPDSLDQVSIYQMLSTWDENSTYNSMVNGVSPDGIEANNTLLYTLDAGGSGTQVFTGLASTLQAWSNGATNNGWLIATALSSADNYTFDSSESITISRRPMLSVTYTPPTPPSLDLDSNNSSGASGSNYTGSFTEGSGAVKVADTDAIVTAGSNTISSNLSGMTVTISNLLDGSSESLSATTTGTSITASYNSGTGVLTLSGSDTAANYQTVLRTISYNNSSNNPTTTSRIMSIVATDPYGGNSTTATSTIAINAVNSLPTNTVPSAQTTNEDTAKVFSSANGNQISITDADAGAGSNEITLTVTNGTLTLAGTTGLTFTSGDGTADSTMTFRGTASAINTALNGLIYTPTANYSGSATLTLRTLDSTLVSLNIDANLQGRYTFENNANDVATGTAQNGTLVGNATYISNGTRGQVLTLDGSGDSVQINSTYGQSQNVTIGGWVNLSAGTGRKEFISIDDRVHIALDDAGGVKGSVQVGAGVWTDLNSNQFIAGTGWHHVMYVFNGTSDVHTLYIDGVQVASAANTDTIYYTDATTTYIGQHPTNTSWNVNGLVDDVRIYDKALTGSEVAALAADLSLIDTDTVAISVAAVNDAPLIDNTKSPSLNTINEDAAAPSGAVGTLVSLLVDFASSTGQVDNINDVDSSALLGLAITAADTANGSWWYSTNNGTTWNAMGAVSHTNALLLAADFNTRIYFQPNLNYNGTLSNAITFHAWDQSSGTNGGSANITVTNTVLDSFSTVSYNNNNGTVSWSTSWAETDSNGGGAGGGRIRVNGNQLEIRADTVGDSIYREVNLSGSLSATLSFTYNSNLSGGDNIVVRISNNGGTSYTNLPGGAFTNSVSGTFNLDISTYISSNTRIQFYVAGAGNKNDLLVDNVQISYTLANFGGTTAYSSATDTASLVISAINDTPTATNLSAAETYTEDTALNLTDIVISDIDSASVTATLTLSNAAAGSLNTATSGVVTSTYNTGTGEWTASGAVSDVNTLLAGLTFTPAANFNSSFTISTSVSDGAATVTGSKAMTGTAVNDAPIVTINSSILTSIDEDVLNPNGTSVLSLFGANFSDSADSLNLEHNQFAGIAVRSQNTTNIATEGRWQYSIDNGTSWNNFIAVSNSSAISLGSNDLLRFLPAENFNGLTDVITARLIDNSVTVTSGNTINVNTNGGVTAYSSSFVSLAARVNAINDTPTATNLSAAETYTEDTVLNLTDIVISDIDSATVTATLTFSNAAAGSLNTATSGVVTSTYNTGTGEWTASGAVADVNTLLAGLTFTPTANFNSSFTIATSISDGTITLTGTKTMTGTAVNDAPVLNTAANPVLVASSEHAGVPVGAAGTLVSILVDIETPAGQNDNVTEPDIGASLGIALTSINEAYGVWYYSIDNGTNWLRLSNVTDSSARLLAADGTTRIYFEPNTATQFNGSITNAITFRAWDQTAGINGGVADTTSNGSSTAFSMVTDTATLNITPVNDAPQFKGGELITNGTFTTNLSGWTTTGTVSPLSGRMQFGINGNIGPHTASQTIATTAGQTYQLEFDYRDTLATKNQTMQISVDGLSNLMTTSQIVTDKAGTGSVRYYYTFVADFSSTTIKFTDTSDQSGLSDNTLGVDGQIDNISIYQTNGEAGSLSYNENQAATAIYPTLTLSDFENSILTGATIQITAGFSSAQDMLAFTNQNGITGSYNSSTGVLTLSGASSLVNYQTALRSIMYFNSSDSPSALRTVSFTVNDGTLTSSVTTRDIAITAVNDPPSVTNISAVENYTEDTTLNLTDIVISDVDSATVTATVTLSNTSSGSLNTATSGSVTSTYNAGTGVWTASGALANVNTLLAGLTFTPATNFNSNFTIGTSINDGTSTLIGTKAMTGTAVNDEPVLSNLGNTVFHTEDDSSTVLAPSVTVTDAELSSANNFNGATLTLARNGGANTQDALAFDGINVTISGANVSVGGAQVGTYTFTGGQMVVSFGSNATQARINTLMQNIVYWNTSDVPPSSVQIDWTFNDGNTGTQGTGGALTETGITTVTITSVNDAPSGTNNNVTATEETTYTFSISDFGFSDTDGNAIKQIWFDTLPSQGTLQWNGNAFSAGNFVFANDISSGLLTYVPAVNSSGTGVASFTFRVQDDGGTVNGGSDIDSTVNTITINITPVNDAPTATNLSAPETYTEDAALNLTDIVISDVDSANVTATLTLSNAAAGSLNTATSGTVTSTYNAGTGIWTASGTLTDVNVLLAGLTFTPATNFNANFTIATSVSDGTVSNTGTKTITGTAVNDNPTGSVTISGTSTQNQTLTAANTLTDADGLGTISYQWLANGVNISGATGNTYTLTEAEVGKVITVIASYTDGHGTNEAVSSAATAAVANVNDNPTGSVTISGTSTQNQTLTAANTLTDADGLGTISYQWLANGVNISGATGNTYTLTEAEVGKVITVIASYTDGHGTNEAVSSAATAAVANVNDNPTGSVTISGTPTQNQTLTATNTLADTDGLGTISYQWQANGADISGATGNTYTLTEAEVGKVITVIASYTDGHGTNEAVTSAATAAVANVNDNPTGSVTISGTPTQNQTLMAANTLADADGLGTITYTWKANGSTVGMGSTYVLTEAEVGKVITVIASYTDGHGTAEAVTSAATTAVANVNDNPTGSVTISGTPTQNQTLTAANTLADTDGLGTITYTWKANGTTVGTGSTYVLTEAEVGKVITVVASYTDGHGTAEAVTNAATAAVANVNDTPTGSVTISGTPTQNQTLTAANTLADADGLGTISYQWLANGVNISGATGNTYTLTEAEVGKIITVIASYTDDHGTNEAVTSTATAAVANVNDNPTIANPLVDQIATEDLPFSFVVPANSFTDVDAGDSLTYAATLTSGGALPSWLSFNSITRTFSGMPTNAHVGSISVRVTATDGSSASVFDDFTLTVNNSNDLPTTTPVLLNAILEDSGPRLITQAELLANAIDIDGDFLRAIDLVITHGNGILVNNDNGTWSYTPALNDDTSVVFTYTISDGNGGYVTGSANLDILAVNDAPVITSGSVAPSIAENSGAGQVVYTVSSSDVDGPIDTNYRLLGADSDLFSINSTSGEVTLLQSPNFESKSNYSFTIIATDAAGNTSDEKVVNLTINNVDELPTGTVAIIGKLAKGEMLFAESNLDDPDGMGPVSFVWKAGDIVVGTGNYYKLTEADIGKPISVTANYIDGYGSNVVVDKTIKPTDFHNPTFLNQDKEKPTTSTKDTSVHRPLQPDDRNNRSYYEGDYDSNNEKSRKNKEPLVITDLSSHIDTLVKKLTQDNAIRDNERKFIDADSVAAITKKRTFDYQFIDAPKKHSSYEEQKLNEASEQAFLAEMDHIREQFDNLPAVDDTKQVDVQIMLGTTVAFTAGFVSWVLRGGALLSSFMSTVPLINRFDPVPILRSSKKTTITRGKASDKREDEKTVAMAEEADEN